MEAQMTIKVIGEHKVVKVQNLLRKSIAELSDINARESDFFLPQFKSILFGAPNENQRPLRSTYKCTPN